MALTEAELEILIATLPEDPSGFNICVGCQ